MQYGFDEYAIIFKAMSDEHDLKYWHYKRRNLRLSYLEEFHFTQPTLISHETIDRQRTGRCK